MDWKHRSTSVSRRFRKSMLLCVVSGSIIARKLSKRDMELKGAYIGSQPSNATAAPPPYGRGDVATGPGYGAPQQQQQQPQVVVVGAGQQQSTAVQPVDSYVNETVLSCVVLWLGNLLFGLAAYNLAS